MISELRVDCILRGSPDRVLTGLSSIQQHGNLKEAKNCTEKLH